MSDVFSGDNKPTVAASDLVGDGKKFKTVDDLARGKAEADAFIEQLQRENAGLRETANKNINAEQQLEALKNELKALREAGAQNQPKGNTSQALSEREVEALVERTVTERERTKTAVQNVTEANNRAIKHFGTEEAAAKAIMEKAAELGISMERLKTIAAESPTAFAKIVGITEVAPANTAGSFVQPSAGAPDPKVITPTHLKPGTYEYAEHVRKTDPQKYWRPEFQMKHVWDAAKAGTYIIPKQ